jgi:hypothetical protein
MAVGAGLGGPASVSSPPARVRRGACFLTLLAVIIWL